MNSPVAVPQNRTRLSELRLQNGRDWRVRILEDRCRVIKGGDAGATRRRVLSITVQSETEMQFMLMI